MECLPADKPWDVVSVTRRNSGVAPRDCVRVYARVLVPPDLYIHTHRGRRPPAHPRSRKPQQQWRRQASEAEEGAPGRGMHVCIGFPTGWPSSL